MIKLDSPCWRKNYQKESRHSKYWKRLKHRILTIKQKYMNILNHLGKLDISSSSFSHLNCLSMYLRRYWKLQWMIQWTSNVFINLLYIVTLTIALTISIIRKEQFWRKSKVKKYLVISFSGNFSYFTTFEQQ